MAGADDTDIELVSCGVIDSPANLTQRLRLGGLGATLTLLAVFGAQWWITRRT
jgi:hypothetical protein